MSRKISARLNIQLRDRKITLSHSWIWGCLLGIHPRGFNLKIKDFKGGFSVISSVTNPFCSTCNRIRLTADGKLKNCLFSNSETSLLETLRAGESIEPLIFQNIKFKKAMRGGMDDDAKFQNPKLFSKNRSMIKIGGQLF